MTKENVDFKIVTNLELSLLNSSNRKKPDLLNELIDDNFIEFGVRDKKEFCYRRLRSQNFIR